MDANRHPNERLLQALTAAVLQLLRPLCKLLLRHNLPFSVLEELAKRVYVQVAMEDFGIPGKKPSLSRASILTGLTRKDAQRLVAATQPLPAPAADGYNRAARVLTAWARDPDFQDVDGAPAALPMQISTIDHNLQHGDSDPRYQRKVLYLNMPADAVAEFRRRSANDAQALLEKLDRWLAANDIDNPPDRPDAPRVRLGMGINYIEAPVAPTSTKDR